MVARRIYCDDDAGTKEYRLGTHRTVSPHATLARADPHLGEMGITRIANVTGLDKLGIPVVMVCRPNSRSISVSQGKGVELAAAKASGVMEAVETYHAERITLPLKFASFDELHHAHPMVDVAKLPFSVGDRYRNDRALLWIEGRNLMNDEPLWLPHELVHTDYTLPQPTGSGCFAANTNGLASGNHILEAIAHGLYEVIERDAITLWRLQRSTTGGQPLNLSSVNDGSCRALLERFECADIDVRVWNATSDVGVACFFCLVMGRQEDDTEPEFGSGCHPVREVALLRALTEAAQARTTYIAGSRDDFAAEIYSAAARAERTYACRELLASQAREQTFEEVPSFESDTLWEDISWTLGQLQAVGVNQVVAVDLTQERFRIPVARVVIPGLEGVYKGEHSDYVAGERARAIPGHTP
jgi:ribosomal protein S12 methylthiotransferase accessory factor